jgi:hypothetical protein
MGKRVRKARAEGEAPKGGDVRPDSGEPDPRVLVIARAIGRLIAREQNAAKARDDR